MSSNVNGPRAPATLASSHAVTGVDVDAWHVVHAARYGIPVSCRSWPSMSPTQPSRPRSSTVPRPLPWSSICGHRGAARAARSARSSRRSSTRPNGEVVLVKVNVDENPGVSQAFQVQSIPAVYALKDGEVVDGFVGAHPEHVIEEFVANLLPSEAERTVASLLAAGAEGAFGPRWSSSRPTRTRSSAWPSCSSPAARPRRRWRSSPASPRPTGPAGSPPRPASARSRPDHRRLRRPAHRPARPGEGRRRGPPAVRRHPRADGPDDPRTAGYRKQLTARLY